MRAGSRPQLATTSIRWLPVARVYAHSTGSSSHSGVKSPSTNTGTVWRSSMSRR